MARDGCEGRRRDEKKEQKSKECEVDGRQDVLGFTAISHTRLDGISSVALQEVHVIG
jgi:hypothetical protein